MHEINLTTKGIIPKTGVMSIWRSRCSFSEKFFATLFIVVSIFSNIYIQQRCQKRVAALLEGSHLEQRQVVSFSDSSPALPQGSSHPDQSLRIEVVNITTLKAVAHLKESDASERIAVLDLASDTNPGGAFLYSPFHGSQEENLCEQTSLYHLLRSYKNENPSYIPKEGCLFIPDVQIFYQEDGSWIQKEEERPRIDVAAVAAIDFRQCKNRDQYADMEFSLKGSYRLNNRGLELTKKKMRCLLNAFKTHDVKNLVLGALGCGAYLNDPAIIAECWDAVLKEYHGQFNRVVFAIATPDTGVTDNNFNVFKKVFCKTESFGNYTEMH